MKLKSKMLEFLESEEGQKSLQEWANKINNEAAILTSQLERFNKKFDHLFKEVVNKIVAKYDSDAYVNRWYNRHIEPPETLYWFLFEYAERYGHEATKEEYKKYGNMFTSAMFYIHDFYFGRMDGQGSVMQIYERKDD